ncbi:MAG: hypothetical protein AAF718_02070 [Pseudomonadota bacterium]
MAVKDTLDKIVERHPDVIGAMVTHNGQLQHNLESPYDIIDVEAILETFSEIFEQTTILGDEGYDFGEVMIDFANHSFIVRSIEGGLLAVLAPQLQRGQLVKLHVGLGIFGKAIEKAIEQEGFADDALESEPSVEAVAETPRVTSQPLEIDGVSSGVPDQNDASEQHQVDEVPREEGGLGSILGLGKKRRGGFRGSRELLASRVASAAHEAVGEPTPKDEPSVNAEGIPLRPDGTPMKKRIYRGSVFWE